jgi:hypothetical protein
VTAVAWALRPDAIAEPLVIVAASKSIFIVDLNSRTIIGKIRGHGGVTAALSRMQVLLIDVFL